MMNLLVNLDDVFEVNIYVDFNGSFEFQFLFFVSYNNGNGVYYVEVFNF